MLKCISVLLAILLIAPIVFVPHADATSDTVVLSHIQAGISGGATQEFIGLFNNSLNEVDLTDWCLRNKNDVDFACFNRPEGGVRYVLPARSSALVASENFAMNQSADVVASIVYLPLSTSSGSIVGSNDHISVVNTEGLIVDAHSWASGNSSLIFQRQLVGDVYVDTDAAADWQQVPRTSIPRSELEYRMVEPEPPVEMIHPIITELLPNAAGADEGKEFIEFYNPSDVEAVMSDYYLWVGLEPKSPLTFPDDVVIAPKSYGVVTHEALKFSLVNTTGKVVLTSLADEVVSETEVYTDPDDDTAWALLNDTWQYTNVPTPSLPNVPSILIPDEVKVVPARTVKPCAANQYRHTETRRCRLLVTATSTRKPCKANQYRSPETNRCRTIAVAAKPTPCKEGQERNPETGRCRMVKKMTTADYSVLAATTESRPSQWYIIAAIGTLLLVIIAYGIWEWRVELKDVAQKSLRFLQRHK